MLHHIIEKLLTVTLFIISIFSEFLSWSIELWTFKKDFSKDMKQIFQNNSFAAHLCNPFRRIQNYWDSEYINLHQNFYIFDRQHFFVSHNLLYLSLSIFFWFCVSSYVYLLAIPSQQDLCTVSTKNSIYQLFGFFLCLFLNLNRF